jgi:hypothetical protein
MTLENWICNLIQDELDAANSDIAQTIESIKSFPRVRLYFTTHTPPTTGIGNVELTNCRQFPRRLDLIGRAPRASSSKVRCYKSTTRNA